MGQLSLSTGKIRRKFPTLSSVQDRIALTVTSPSGSYLGGLLLEGDIFIWDKCRDMLLTFVTPLSSMGKEKLRPQAHRGEVNVTVVEQCDVLGCTAYTVVDSYTLVYPRPDGVALQ